jgi:hypothetical protein
LNRSEDNLIGVTEITEYTGIQSVETVRKFIQAGLPAFVFNNRWYSSKRAIDEFFYRLSIAHGHQAIAKGENPN